MVSVSFQKIFKLFPSNILITVFQNMEKTFKKGCVRSIYLYKLLKQQKNDAKNKKGTRNFLNSHSQVLLLFIYFSIHMLKGYLRYLTIRMAKDIII